MTIISKSPEDTLSLGQKIGKSLKTGMILSLEGPLGSGKTVLVKGIARALKIRDTVTSPSFTIMSVYTGRIKLYHVDLYRLSAFDELEYLGITDLFYGDGITVIEWGEKAEGILPENTIRVIIELMNSGFRKISVKGLSE